jgi:predicted nucleic-acid-binding protein
MSGRGRTGLDTNVLVRYFIDDENDQGPATLRQRAAAMALIESGLRLAVARTVLLELEWVLRGLYNLKPPQIAQVLRHLLALPQLEVDSAPVLARAVELMLEGFDFADALHHASYADCDAVASFDDRGFARRAQRRALLPRVFVPQ